MSVKTNRPLQIGLFLVDLIIIVVVLYEVSLVWRGAWPLSRSGPVIKLDTSSSVADAALQLVMQKRRFTYEPVGKRDPFKSLLMPEKPVEKPKKKVRPKRVVKPRFKFQGVIWDEEQPLAFLGGTKDKEKSIVRIGDEVDSYKILEITKDSLTVISGETEFILKIGE